MHVRAAFAEASSAPSTPSSDDLPPTPYVPPSAEEETLLPLLRDPTLRIPPRALQVLENIGSGMWGEVHRGVWMGARPVPVALKSLLRRADVAGAGTEVDEGSGGERAGRLKLLQEAAVAKQFRHRHVLRLLGTSGNPASPMLVCVGVWVESARDEKASLFTADRLFFSFFFFFFLFLFFSACVGFVFSFFFFFFFLLALLFSIFIEKYPLSLLSLLISLLSLLSLSLSLLPLPLLKRYLSIWNMGRSTAICAARAHLPRCCWA